MFRVNSARLFHNLVVREFFKLVGRASRVLFQPADTSVPWQLRILVANAHHLAWKLGDTKIGLRHLRGALEIGTERIMGFQSFGPLPFDQEARRLWDDALLKAGGLHASAFDLLRAALAAV